MSQAEQERRQAQLKSQEESQQLSKLEARLNALVTLQEDVQKKGALEPWLNKHELTGLARLWQQVHIEPGWETALESVLRERMTALEVHNLDLAKAFATDVPPARLAFFHKPAAQVQPVALAGFRPLVSLVRVNDVDLKSLLAQWLANIYIADDLSMALSQRTQLKDGAQLVVKQGHVVDAYGVYFYAAES